MATANSTPQEVVTKIIYIKKQVYKDPKGDYRILKIWNEDRTKEATAKGIVHDPVIGGRYKVKGIWKHDQRRAEWQLELQECNPDFDRSEEAMVNYLKTELKGLGEARARELYSVYGVKTIDVLRERPDEIATNFHVPAAACHAIAEYLTKESAGVETKKQLYEIGLTAWEVNTIISKLGANAGVAVRENCFQLTDIKGLGWQKVSKIADSMGVAKEDPNRIKAAIMYAVSDLTSGGHVCIYGHEIIDQAQKMIGIPHLNISSEIEALITEGKLYSEETDPEQVIEDQQVFQEAMLDAELAKVFK